MAAEAQIPLYLLLASMSRYRAQCLAKLRIPFAQWAPDIDETPKIDETPYDLVKRLARSKAQASLDAGQQQQNAQTVSHVIASDQVLLLDQQILGKPLSQAKAQAQLTALAGQTVTFYTSLCVVDVASSGWQVEVDTTQVHFRALSQQQIAHYIALENPIDCAGSFKSEGAGALLCHSIEGRDPNSLVGLPLMLLADILAQFGYSFTEYTPTPNPHQI